MDEQSRYNALLARDGLSVNAGKMKPRRRKPNPKLYVRYLEHPTAQYRMSFIEWKRRGGPKGRLKAYDA